MENLGSPIKSPLDDNDYKLVKLPNGIRALLITEHHVRPGDDHWTGDENCMDVAVTKFNHKYLKYHTNDECELHEKRGKSKERNKKCKFDHGTMAAVALSVGVGSFSNPESAPGLAHLCEHMLFLGSEKYPGRDDFDTFITENGGESNAFTQGETTIYLFSVDNDKLEEALTRMVQFFIAPIMNIDDISIERDIVDSEFHTGKKMDDETRRLRLFQIMGKKNHPMNRFCPGNKLSLTTIDNNDEALLQLLINFRETYYGAEHMTMAIQAGYHTKELEKIVGRVCGEIPRSGVPRPVFSEPFPYRTPEFRKMYEVIPVNDETTLFITWDLPAMPQWSYKTKPLEYIERLVEHEACGGLAYILRKRLWITKIGAGVGQHYLERNSCCSLFTIEFSLTEEGLKHYETILEITFTYLKLIQKFEPSAWYFTEFQEMSSVVFHTMSNPSLLDDVNMLARKVRACDPSDILFGNILVTEWDPDMVLKYMKMLRPQTANYMLFSKSFDESCTQEEEYFGIRYHTKEIPAELINKLRRVRVANHFGLKTPCPNPFVATNFCKVKEFASSPNSRDWPVCVFKMNKTEFWSKHEWNPGSIAEATYQITFLSALHQNDASMAALLDLWVQIIQSNVVPIVQCGSEARLYFEIERTLDGVNMEFGGLIHKLLLFVNKILDHVFRVCQKITEPIFQLNKTIQLQKYYQESSSPELLISRLKDFIVTNAAFMPSQLYDALQETTFEDFQDFCTKFTQSVYVLGLAEGNVTQFGTREFASSLMRRLKYDENRPTVLPNIMTRQLPLGDAVCRILSVKKDDNSAAIANVYQIDLNSKNMSIIKILTDLMYEPAFQFLRTEENLGYVVEVEWSCFYSSLEFYIGVLTHSDKFTGSQVKAKIDEFVVHFYEKYIYKMTQGIFDKIKETQGFFETKIWSEIMSGDFMFDRATDQEEIVRNLRVHDFKRFYETYLLPKTDKIRAWKSKIRQISVQVVGPADTEYPVQTNFSVPDPISPEYIHSEFEVMEDENGGKNGPKYPFIGLSPVKESESEPCSKPESKTLRSQSKAKENKNLIIIDFKKFKKTMSFLPRQKWREV